jgi:hypothetical protein
VSPIIDIQRQLVEVGRIRMGTTKPHTTRSGKNITIPVRLDTWRLTSRDQKKIEAAATVFGGEPKPWRDGEWEVITATDQLPIVLMPGQNLSQWYELWGQTARGKAVECLRRCDGKWDVKNDRACSCPQDHDERREKAKEGEACDMFTRLSVILPDVPGMGVWRLETQSYYAAIELAGAASLLELVTARGALMQARLRIDHRSAWRNGEKTNFPVPVIDIDAGFGDILALGQGAAPGGLPAGPSTSGYVPVPEGSGVGVAEGLSQAQSVEQVGRRGRTPDIGASGFEPDPTPIEPDDAAPEATSATPEGSPEPSGAGGSDEPLAAPGQVRMIRARAEAAGLDEDSLTAVLQSHASVEVVEHVPKAKVNAVLKAIAEAGS